MKHVVIVGPQGAGKGTQAERVAPQLGLVHLATGDLFRELMASGSDLAEEVRSYVDTGELVPDELTAKVLFSALDEAAAAGDITGALFDGYPRNIAQAEVLDEMLAERGDELSALIHIDVPHDVLMERITGRRLCRDCGRGHHTVFNPPSTENECDDCGGELYQRSDDTPEAVERRLNIYYQQTEPLLERWRPRGIVHDISGDQPIEKVTSDIMESLRKSAV